MIGRNRYRSVAAPDDGQARLRFSAVDETTLQVVDPIERHRYALEVSRSVSPTAVPTDRFRFPVDAAVAVTTASVELPTVVLVHVRDDSGDAIASAEHFAYQELPAGRYELELSAPIKLYLRVESRLTIAADDQRTKIEFDGETEVLVGGRSYHDHPAGTITTTEDPLDVMAAVSALSSALKTTSPERSYPTLRGHPPTIELGDRLDVPDGLERPDTGIRIELPPEYGSIYVAAPLAFYLGAELVPGPTPRLVTETGFEYDLDSLLGFETEVERTLKQVFLLDCLTRTEGLYPFDLHERNALESSLGFDFASLYAAPLAEQVESYLSVPYEVVEEHVPQWKLTTHVAPTPDGVEMLPFLVDDLAVVRTPRAREATSSDVQVSAIDEFFRDDFTRSASEAPPSTVDSYVEPERSESIEQIWVGEGTPLGASKATPTAYRNRLERPPKEGDIDITVVCNDPEMGEEREVVDEVYGSRSELPFEVSVHHELTVDELAALLESRSDFLHYIGHIDGEGFQCTDGKLDARTLDSVGVDAFLLNACQSYDQGMALVDAGAIAGVVTLADVINSGAISIGSTMARLLNGGFPLHAALTIAREQSVVGGQYTVVGDGGIAVTQAEGGTPNLAKITREGDRFEVEVKTYPTSQSGMGSVVAPYLKGVDESFLSSGDITGVHLHRDELLRYFGLEDVPVLLDGELHWSTDVTRSML